MIYVKNPPKHAAEISIQSIFYVKRMTKKAKNSRFELLF